MKDTIICLVGESGSGKTTIAMALEAIGYNVISSYTTRSPRKTDEWGHTFVDGTVLQEHLDMQDYIVAYKFYDGFHYWATKDQYLDHGVSIYVVDPDGIKMLRSKVTDARIIVIYLKADKEERICRMKDQGRSVLDVGRRVGYDRTAFRLIRCDYVVDANSSIEDTICQVNDLIKGL
jgi:guanylate kinase